MNTLVNDIKEYVGQKIKRIQLHYKKKSLRAAVEAAREKQELTGRKCFVFEIKGEFKVMYKSDFKYFWHRNPSLKKHTIEQWEAYSESWFKCYEDLKFSNKFSNSN